MPWAFKVLWSIFAETPSISKVLFTVFDQSSRQLFKDSTLSHSRFFLVKPFSEISRVVRTMWAWVFLVSPYSDGR